MSFEADEICEVWRETSHIARKEHACTACRDTIRKGDRYFMTFSIFEGNASTIRRCARCEAIYQHLQAKVAAAKHDGYLCVAPALDCGMKYEEEWGPLPDDIAALAFVTPDEMQSKIRGAQ